MKKQQLKRVKRAVEAFFYKARFNIALHDTLDNKKHHDFRKKIEKAILKQILFFSKKNKVAQVIGVNKAVKELNNKDLLKNIILIWIPLTNFITEVEIASYIEWAGNKGGQSGVNKLKSDLKFKLENKALLASIKKRPSELVKFVDGTTQDWIARTIEEGVNKGLSEYEIASMLRRNATSSAKERAEVVAEQEAALIMGEMEVEVFKRNKIKLHSWITSRDEMVCVECMTNEEAGDVKVGDEFPGGVLSSPQHVRCRCMTMPKFSKEVKILWAGE